MSRNPPHEPTRHVLPAPHEQGRGDGPPPLPPHEQTAAAAAADTRHFDAGGESWLARLSGKGACGTGSYGLGLVEAVHFFRASAPDTPVREALLEHGRFAFMYDAELVALLQKSQKIVDRG